MSADQKWDGILVNVLQDTGDYDQFFDYMFGFLRRKTDFFSDMKRAEKTIATAGRKNIEQLQDSQKDQKAKDEEKRKRDAEREAVRQKKREEAIVKA